MTTLSFVSTKGGVGKSTLTWITACALAHNYGKSVAIIDADTQMSLFKTASLLDKLPFVVLPSSLSEIYDKVMSIHTEQDVILIDMPGILHTPDGSRQHITEFLFFVDVMLMPLKAHDFDALNLVDFIAVVEEVIDKRKQKYDVPTQLAYFINDLHSKAEARDLERFMVQRQLPLLDRNISRSVYYERATRSSESLITAPHVSTKVQNETRLFVDAIAKLV
jgi:cellulose biosynthesis protein BcsQ